MRTLSLSALPWEFRQAPTGGWRDARVPGCVHRDLLAHKLIPDPFRADNERLVQWVGEAAWEYRVRFDPGAALRAAAQVELVADGLDTLATVFLNGRKLGDSDNMFVPNRWPLRGRLRPGSNELLIRFDSAEKFVRTQRRGHRPKEINDPVGGATRLRKQQCQFGWDWAPRLVTAGIWRELRLEAWTGNRLVDVRVAQTHHRDGSVMLDFAPEFVRHDSSIQLSGIVSLHGEVVAEIKNQKSKIENPALWWPNGQGAQPLYDVTLEARRRDGSVIGAWSRRIGLRTLELRRERDRWGESFEFVVNGRPIFAKGASWIPAHSFVAGLQRDDYQPLLASAVRANFNMIRVWGGGVYEHEAFYDLCDELGLMVWQDFMFACTLYPGDPAFRQSVRREATAQVRRLRHRACLALWCGNNELELLNREALKEAAARRAYEAIFARALPEIVAAEDGSTAYWRSSPSQAKPGDNPEQSGNAHFWDVWHARFPVERYEEKHYRFVAEFGMQSFPSQDQAREFCGANQLNVFSRHFEAHQKNPSGNQIILDYVSRRYRFPKDYAALAYLSQLNQAHCMRVGVEHYRRSRPRTMGALYWQLNDCWPCASWSSLEFNGQWKPLHYAARRFYAPLLVSARVLGRETIGIGNRTKSDVRGVELHTVSDLPAAAQAVLRWRLCTLDGRTEREGSEDLTLAPGRAQRQVALDFAAEFERDGADIYYLRYELRRDGGAVSEETALFTTPRAMELPTGRPKLALELVSERCLRLRLVSDVWLHRCWVEFPGFAHHAEDNCFDLFPGEARVIRVDFAQPVTLGALNRRLRFISLADTYA
jgi:beta-mannosidase